VKAAIILSILGGLLMIGIAAATTLNNKVDRVEDKSTQRLERIEDKIDNQSKDINNLSIAIGRIEEKLD